MNKCIMIGNLTNDVDLRATPSGVSVASFGIAVNRKRPSSSGERVTDFFTVVAWRQLGDLCGKYLSKGKKVCVTGELHTRTYDDKNGVKRHITEIVAEDVEFLTPKGDAQTSCDASIPDGFEEIDDEELPF